MNSAARTRTAAPATGYSKVHQEEQDKLIDDALTGIVDPVAVFGGIGSLISAAMIFTSGFTEHPAFANARGMLKYLRFVCEVPV